MGKRYLYLIPILTTVLVMAAGVEPAEAADKLGAIITRFSGVPKGVAPVLSVISYISGAYLGMNALFRMRAHVDNPNQQSMFDIAKRFIAGGMFLSLPFMTQAVYGSTFKGNASMDLITGLSSSSVTKGGLDEKVVMMMSDIYGPITHLLTAFSYLSAVALLMVGISRLTKKVEEGPRGPAGMGTLMTFIASGALFSFGGAAATFSGSLFGDASVAQNISISTDVIKEGSEGITNVIRALLAFVMLVGFVAFIRGWFVLKAFADGQSGATLAQGLTFLLGGTIAINLGDFVQALSNTMGLDALSFS